MPNAHVATFEPILAAARIARSLAHQARCRGEPDHARYFAEVARAAEARALRLHELALLVRAHHLSYLGPRPSQPVPS